MSEGAIRIAAERTRQIQEEGFDPGADKVYNSKELLQAAAAYVISTLINAENGSAYWPWALKYFKPTDPIRNLEKAGALIAAEIDRLLKEQ